MDLRVELKIDGKTFIIMEKDVGRDAMTANTFLRHVTKSMQTISVATLEREAQVELY